MKTIIIAGACGLLAACANAPKAGVDAVEGHLVDVASMSLYCLQRGKILALVGVSTNGQPIAGACADPPAAVQGRPS